MKNIDLQMRKFNNPNPDLYITDCGYEKCLPLHSYGPAVRNYYLIHIVIEGKGEYFFNGKTYKVEKNQGFIIFPGDNTKYVADSETPWHYYWVGFNGGKSKHILTECGINRDNPVIIGKNENLMKKYIISLFQKSKTENFNEYTMLGYLYLFFSSLKNNDNIKTNKQRYIDNALNYIKDNFMDDIKIDGLAKSLFLERSYLYRLFMDNLGVSPLNYLTKYRLNIACELLNYSNHNITDIAGYVGFSSSSAFCKAFKKEYGRSPLNYRNKKSILNAYEPHLY